MTHDENDEIEQNDYYVIRNQMNEDKKKYYDLSD